MNDFQNVKRELDMIYHRLDGKKLVLYPYGKLGRIAEYILSRYNRKVDIFVDQNAEALGDKVADKSVLDDLELGEYALLSASYMFSYDIVREMHEKYGNVEGFACYNIARNIPNEVNIGITNLCNLSCSFCINKELPKRSLDTETVLRTVEQCVQAGIDRVCVMGHGEPLLHPGFFDIMKCISKKPFKEKCFYTNGYGLKGEIAEDLARLPLTRIYISLTGYADDVFAQMQGNERDAAVIKHAIYQNINAFLELVNKNESGIKVALIYIFKDEYSDDLEKYIEYWEPLVDEIEIRGLVQYDKLPARTSKARCGLLGNVLGIDHYGTVSPCCLGGEVRESVDIPDLGNIEGRDGLDSIVLESEELQRLFTVNAKGDWEGFPKQCKKCTYLSGDPMHNFYFRYSYLKSLQPVLSHIRTKKEQVNFYGATYELAALLTLARIKGESIDFKIYDDEAEAFGSYHIHPAMQEHLDGKLIYVAATNSNINKLLELGAIPVYFSDFQ